MHICVRTHTQTCHTRTTTAQCFTHWNKYKGKVPHARPRSNHAHTIQDAAQLAEQLRFRPFIFCMQREYITALCLAWLHLTCCNIAAAGDGYSARRFCICFLQGRIACIMKPQAKGISMELGART